MYDEVNISLTEVQNLARRGMERGRKAETSRRKKIPIFWLLLAVLHITMPALGLGNYSSSILKMMSLIAKQVQIVQEVKER